MLVSQRVAKGVARLDVHVPEWDRQVNHNSLRMWSIKGCVLGQIFNGQIEQNLVHLGPAEWSDLKSEGFIAYTSEEWMPINLIWIGEIWSRPHV